MTIITSRGDRKSGGKFSIILPLSGSLKSASGLLRRLDASVKGLPKGKGKVIGPGIFVFSQICQDLSYMVSGQGIYDRGDRSPVPGFALLGKNYFARAVVMDRKGIILLEMIIAATSIRQEEDIMPM